MPQVATDVAAAERWRLCLHEAGHAIAGRVLLGTARAVVSYDGCGAAYMGDDRTGADCFERMLPIAAGPAAELLADRYTPPTQAARGFANPQSDPGYPDHAIPASPA